MNHVASQPGRPVDAIVITTYSDLYQYVGKVSERALDLLLIIGRHGTGKSECVRRLLGGTGACPDSILYIEGHAQPFGIYHGLWVHRNHPVVLDDVDRLYANPDCVRLLKPLCEARPVKRVSWLTNATMNGAGPPPSFETSSPVILIANEWRSLNANVRALEDRAIIVQFEPSNLTVHEHVAQWFHDDEVYQFIEAHLSTAANVSMRWYAKAQKLRLAGFRDWRTSVLQMMRCDFGLAVVADLVANPTYRGDQERVAAFRARTGQSRATYYRLKTRLGHGWPLCGDGAGRSARESS